MARSVVSFGPEDKNDLTMVIVALKDHKKMMMKPAKVADKKRREKYIDRCQKMIEFFEAIYNKV